MNTSALVGRLEATVWFIDGGGARVRLGDIVMPELFNS